MVSKELRNVLLNNSERMKVWATRMRPSAPEDGGSGCPGGADWPRGPEPGACCQSL